MWSRLGFQGPPLGSVSTLWKTPHESAGTRTHIGQNLQGSRCFSPMQCQIVDMNVAVHANDERAVEVLASGLPLFHGVQLAVDITLRCALTVSGTPPAVDGIVCAGARAHKELKYAELLMQSSSQVTGVVLWLWPWRPGDDGAQKWLSLLKTWLEHEEGTPHPPFNGPRSSVGDGGGRGCSPSLAAGLLRTLWWRSHRCHTLSRALTGPCPILLTSSGRNERPSCAGCVATPVRDSISVWHATAEFLPFSFVKKLFHQFPSEH